MIRFAEKSDTEKVMALWDRCFGEDKTFNEWFFEKRYRPEETLLSLSDDGELLAMVQMLPYTYSSENISGEVTYIYGACTAPEHRKKGIMAELLNESFRIDTELGRIGSLLIPAEPWLFDFYKKYGYETAFSVQENELVLETDADSCDMRPAELTDIETMNKIYRRHAGLSRLERSEADWEKQIQMFRDLGGEVFVFGNEGYAFVWKNEAGLNAQETMGDNIERYMQSIMRYYSINEIKYTTKGAEKRLGCLRLHNGAPVQMGYFNLLFN